MDPPRVRCGTLPPDPSGTPVWGPASALQVRTTRRSQNIRRDCAGGNMETQRLRAIRASQSCHGSAGVVGPREPDVIPAKARRIRAVGELSEPLRGMVRRCYSDESVWCSWRFGHRIWFVAAAPSLELARERKKPVLQIKIYNERGEMMVAVAYVHTLEHGWQRCA